MIIMCDHIDDLISCRTIDIDAYQQQDKPSYVVIMRELMGICILFSHRLTVTKGLPMSVAEPCVCRVPPRCFRIWEVVAAGWFFVRYSNVFLL
jgi:hypothetical protein